MNGARTNGTPAVLLPPRARLDTVVRHPEGDESVSSCGELLLVGEHPGLADKVGAHARQRSVQVRPLFRGRRGKGAGVPPRTRARVSVVDGAVYVDDVLQCGRRSGNRNDPPGCRVCAGHRSGRPQPVPSPGPRGRGRCSMWVSPAAGARSRRRPGWRCGPGVPAAAPWPSPHHHHILSTSTRLGIARRGGNARPGRRTVGVIRVTDRMVPL